MTSHNFTFFYQSRSPFSNWYPQPFVHLGKKKSLETRIKMSKPKADEARAKMKKPKDILRCPHCAKEGGKPAMIGWHFELCRELK